VITFPGSIIFIHKVIGIRTGLSQAMKIGLGHLYGFHPNLMIIKVGPEISTARYHQFCAGVLIGLIKAILSGALKINLHCGDLFRIMNGK
jgi:hypothetical protein